MDIKKILDKAIAESGSLGVFSEQCFNNYLNIYSKPGPSDSVDSILPGKVFTFYYNTPNPEAKPLNRRPLLFIENQNFGLDKKIIYGIDLMLLKPSDRLNFLIRFFKVYEKPIRENEERIKGGVPNSQAIIKFDRDIVETLFGGISYKHAYSGFRIDKIKSFRQIPMEDWKNIIYLNTKSMEGINIEEIYKKY